jgi:hypothetical protein
MVWKILTTLGVSESLIEVLKEKLYRYMDVLRVWEKLEKFSRQAESSKATI